MDVLIADLHKATSALVQQLLGEQQPVAQIAQIRMNPQLPRIAEGAYLFRLGSQVGILAVRHVALVDKRLKIGPVFNPVRRVDVHHLHLPAKPFLLHQAVHHQQTVTRNQPIGPIVPVLVELNGLPDRRILFGRGKQR